MIDLNEAYDRLSDEKERERQVLNGLKKEVAAAFEDRSRIDTAFMSHQHFVDDKPKAAIKKVVVEDGVPTKVKIKIYGYHSDKKYRRTVRTDDGMLDEDEVREKAEELIEQIDPIENEAKLTQASADELETEAIELLSEAFGPENVGGQHSDAPVKVYFKKDGSVRLQITDLSAEAMMEIANLAAENDFDLDL